MSTDTDPKEHTMKLDAAEVVVVEKSERLPGFVAYVEDYKVGDPNVSYMDQDAALAAGRRFIERWIAKGLDFALAMRS